MTKSHPAKFHPIIRLEGNMIVEVNEGGGRRYFTIPPGMMKENFPHGLLAIIKRLRKRCRGRLSSLRAVPGLQDADKDPIVLEVAFEYYPGVFCITRKPSGKAKLLGH